MFIKRPGEKLPSIIVWADRPFSPFAQHKDASRRSCGRNPTAAVAVTAAVPPPLPRLHSSSSYVENLTGVIVHVAKDKKRGGDMELTDAHYTTAWVLISASNSHSEKDVFCC